MTNKERIALREIEIMAEARYYKNSGGYKWSYYGAVIDCMTPAEENRYLKLRKKLEKTKTVTKQQKSIKNGLDKI